MPAFSSDFFVARPETGHGLDGSTGHLDGATFADGQEEPKVTVLVGPSGSGKSHLAAAWLSAAFQSQASDVQVWLDASHPSAVLAGYAQAATDLALTGRGAPADASAERFLEWLNHGAGRWHAVFDDVTDPAGLRGLWPTGSGGKVLVTCHPSKDAGDLSAIGAEARIMQLGALSPREALGYLAARLYEARDDRVGAVDLAADLGYLPLALKLATAMVAGSSMTCYDYRRRLAIRSRDLAAYASGRAAASPPDAEAPAASGSGNGQVSPVDAAVSLALDWVDHFTGAGLARAVLALVSLVAPGGVPAHLLVSASGCRFVSSSVRAAAVDPQQVMAAIGALAQASLVHVDGAATQVLVTVHPAVQSTVRRLMPAAVYEAAALAAADAITEVLPLVKDKQGMALAVADCAASLAATAGELLWAPERHAVFASVDSSLGDVGLTGAAVDFWRGLLASDEARQRADPAQVLLMRDSLAAACDADGRSGEAIEITLANLTDRETELGPDHPDTLTTLASLAAYYRSAGTLESAISACERAVAGREWVLGAGHAETLAARAQLASTLHLSGTFDAAIAMYQQNLAERERQLGPVHHDVLTEQASLARTYQSARQYNEAIAIFRKVLAAWEQSLGAGHPDTLSACASLAFAYRSAGRMKEAIPCYRQTVTGREQVLGPDHPDTLTALANLASCYHAASRMKDALPLYERVLSGRERVQGPDHPDTLTARGNLAGGYHSAGRLADALPLYERTVADFERVLGRDHPSTLTSLGNLAQGYYMARRQTDAIAVFERALADATRALGPDHPLTRTISDNLASLARLPTPVPGGPRTDARPGCSTLPSPASRPAEMQPVEHLGNDNTPVKVNSLLGHWCFLKTRPALAPRAPGMIIYKPDQGRRTGTPEPRRCTRDARRRISVSTTGSTLTRKQQVPVGAQQLHIAMVAPPYFDVPPAAYGGIETVVADLVDALVARGHRVTLIGAGRHSTRAQRFLSTYDSGPADRLGEPMPEMVHAAKVASFLDTLDADVIHDHTMVGPLMARGRLTPTVVTAHGPVQGDPGEFYRALGDTVKLVAISNAQRASAPDLAWLATVHNAIRAETFPYRAEKDNYAFFLGRFHPEKAPHLAIDAARAAGMPIVLAGKCSEPIERAYYAREIEPRIGPDVTIAGVAGAVTKRLLLASAACMIFPIQWEEPFGLVVIEAMACGTPVVALRRGAAPELIVHGQTGLVVDEPEELADAIAPALRLDPAMCRKHVETAFTVEVMAEGYEAAYRRALAGATDPWLTVQNGVRGSVQTTAPLLGWPGGTRNLSPSN